MPGPSPFRWNARTGRYVDASGRFVSRTQVRAWLDSALADTRRRMMTAARGFRSGPRTLANLDAFEALMREGIKQAHLYAAMSAVGGQAQMTASDYGRVGRIVRYHYEKLEAWMQDVADGRAPLDGRFAVRAALYAGASRGTYYQFAQAIARAAGATTERNVLGASDAHCTVCVDQSSLGEVPIGTLIPVGQRTCLGNCLCEIEYA